MIFVRNNPILGILFSIILLFSNMSWAHSLQNFAPVTYINPADLTLIVNDFQFLVGDLIILPRSAFNGTITVPDLFAPRPLRHNVISTGQSANTARFNITFGRIAKRIGKDFVIALELNEPFKEDVVYPINSPVRYAATVTSFHSVNLAPNIAYEFKRYKFSLGAGLDIFSISSIADQQVPSLPARVGRRFIPFGTGPDLTATTNASGHSWGWHVGVLFHVLKGTFLGLSYFSPMTPRLSGYSTFTGFPTNNNFAFTFNLPATSNLDIRQFWKITWLTMLRINYTQWNRLQKVVFFNTAVPGTSTQRTNLNYQNTWRIALSNSNNITDKFTLTELIAYDQSPTNNRDRTVRTFFLTNTTLGVGLRYNFSKAVSFEGDLAHVFSYKNAPINYINPNNSSISKGNIIHASANVIGFQFIINT